MAGKIDFDDLMGEQDYSGLFRTPTTNRIGRCDVHQELATHPQIKGHGKRAPTRHDQHGIQRSPTPGH
jgi:hypothetical protein